MLIYEPEASGHHLAYLDWISEALQQQRVPLALGTTPEVVDQISRHWPSLAARFVRISAESARQMPLAGKFGLLGVHLKWWWHFRSIVRSFGSTHPRLDALIPFLPNQFTALAVLGVPKGIKSLSVIGMRDDIYDPDVPTAESGSRRRIALKRLLLGKLLRNPRLYRYFTINPLFSDYAGRHTGRFNKVCYLPDPAPDWPIVSAQTARAHFGLPDDHRKVVMCFGAITLRKSIDRLLDAAADRDIYVLLVGCIDSDVAGLLRMAAADKIRREGRLFVFDRYASARDEQCAYGAADLVWAVYKDFPHMSSVIVAALHAGKPFMTQPDGVMGHFSASLGLPTWSLDHNLQKGNDIDRLLSSNGNHLDQNRLAELRAEHSKANVAGCLTSHLASEFLRLP